MNTITRLEVQSKDKQRANLYLDGKFFCGLDLETTTKNGLKTGTIITEQKLNQIVLESEKQTAFTKALKLVSTRFKTQKEIETYLFDKGYTAQIVFYAIDKLTEYHFVDDERYAQSYINTHRSKYGKLKLKEQLRLKGIKSSIIDKLFNEEFSQDADILALANKYLKSKNGTKQDYLKLFKYLMGKGYQYEEIKNVLKKDIEND